MKDFESVLTAFRLIGSGTNLQVKIRNMIKVLTAFRLIGSGTVFRG